MKMDNSKELLFLPLGGAGEIGMNLNLYGYDHQWLMVDLGITFGDPSLPGVEVVTPDPAFIVERAEELLALIVTHAHEDHLGAVPYLWPQLRCPVYASPFAAAVLANKLRDVGLDGIVPVHIFNPGDKLKLGAFEVSIINITHSIPESHCLAIKTPHGVILHTGDWKLDPEPGLGAVTDIKALTGAGDEGVLAMVCDSTNVFVDGESGSEASLWQPLRELMKNFDGKIAVTTFASNLARVEMLARLGEEVGRHVVLVGRSLHRMVQAARDTGYLQQLPKLLNDEDSGFLPKNKVLYLCTGSQGEPRGAMARVAAGDHPHVILGPGDRAIFSSRTIPGNELALKKLHNGLTARGVEVITAESDLVHVSGHPARDELAQMYNWVRPKMAIPVHGEARHIAEHCKLALSLQVPRAFALENGKILKLAPGEPEIVDQVPVGRLAMDGGHLVSVDAEVIRERRKISFNGLALVSVVIDKSLKLAADPMVSLPGVIDDQWREDMIDDVISALNRQIERLSDQERRDDAALELAIRQVVRKALRKVAGRRPPIEVQICRLGARRG